MISNLMVYSLRFEVPSSANGPNSTPSPSVHNGFLCVPGQVPSRRGSDQSRDGEIQYLITILSKYLKVGCSSSSNKTKVQVLNESPDRQRALDPLFTPRPWAASRRRRRPKRRAARGDSRTASCTRRRTPPTSCSPAPPKRTGGTRKTTGETLRYGTTFNDTRSIKAALSI